MKKIVLRKKIKLSKVIILVIILVVLFTIFLFNIYSKNASNKIKSVANTKIKEYMEYFLSTNIGSEVLGEDELTDLLYIYKNDDGEILYATYNLSKAYETLDIVTKHLSMLINNLENGEGINNNNIVKCKDGISLVLPLFISSSNVFISNLGPDIYIPISFVGSILTNIKSEIKSYGLNNALVELYITISITTNVITPVEEYDNIISYDVLISSYIINGRVPDAYGGVITYDSQQYTLPIN